MPLWRTSAIVIAALLAGWYLIGFFTAASIRTQIEIDAPPEAVWAVLNDTEAHGEWNPFFAWVKGDFVEGEPVEVAFQLGDTSRQVITPTVQVVSPDQELRWVGRIGFVGIFDAEHYFLLEETESGATVLHHGERFSGMLAHPLMALIGPATKDGFTAMNEALKARVEAQDAPVNTRP